MGEKVATSLDWLFGRRIKRKSSAPNSDPVFSNYAGAKPNFEPLATLPLVSTLPLQVGRDVEEDVVDDCVGALLV